MQKLSISKLKTNHLKKVKWSEWIKVFNRVHNPTMFTSVGNIEVKIDDYKKNIYSKKNKTPDRQISYGFC